MAIMPSVCLVYELSESFVETLLPQNHGILNIQTSLKFMKKEFYGIQENAQKPIIGSFFQKKKHL